MPISEIGSTVNGLYFSAMIELVELAVNAVVGLIGEAARELFMLVILTAIGFCYLHLRYRNRMVVAQVLLSKYESSYANAGMTAGLKLIAACGILLVLSFISSIFWSPLVEWLLK